VCSVANRSLLTELKNGRGDAFYKMDAPDGARGEFIINWVPQTGIPYEAVLSFCHDMRKETGFSSGAAATIESRHKLFSMKRNFYKLVAPTGKRIFGRLGSNRFSGGDSPVRAESGVWEGETRR
jgi:hypothetical protein